MLSIAHSEHESSKRVEIRVEETRRKVHTATHIYSGMANHQDCHWSVIPVDCADAKILFRHCSSSTRTLRSGTLYSPPTPQLRSSSYMIASGTAQRLKGGHGGMDTTRTLTLRSSVFEKELEHIAASVRTERLICGSKPVGLEEPSQETLDYSHIPGRVT